MPGVISLRSDDAGEEENDDAAIYGARFTPPAEAAFFAALMIVPRNDFGGGMETVNGPKKS